MRAVILAAVLLAFATSFGSAGSLDASPQAAANCAPLGKIQFLCGVISPEDFAVLPGAEWIITSGNRAGQGAIRALNVREQKVTTLFPPAVKTQPDTKAYPGCPGPLDLVDPAEKSGFATHGLYLTLGSRSVHRLYVVHHGARESVEVFDVDAAARPPALTWVGCVVAPEKTVFNAVVALPEGGVAATGTPRGGPGAPRPGTQALDQPSGVVWEWHAGAGWKKAPGTETPRLNGLEISKDGKWFYLAGWGDQTLVRVERGRTPSKRDVLPMPFRTDNLRFSPNGVLFAAGHGGTALCSCPTETWHIGRVDANAWKVQEILREPHVEGFGAATVAVQIGNDIWIGTNRGDRIGRFPAP